MPQKYIAGYHNNVYQIGYLNKYTSTNDNYIFEYELTTEKYAITYLLLYIHSIPQQRHVNETLERCSTIIQTLCRLMFHSDENASPLGMSAGNSDGAGDAGHSGHNLPGSAAAPPEAGGVWSPDGAAPLRGAGVAPPTPGPSDHCLTGCGLRAKDGRRSVKGRLWCPASGRLVETKRFARHFTGDISGRRQCAAGNKCPLRAGKNLVPFQHEQAKTYRHCPCGAHITATKRGIASVISKHLNLSKRHASLPNQQRESMGVTIRNDLYQTVTGNPSDGSSLPILGDSVMSVALPLQPEGGSRAKQKLALSVATAGEVCKKWVPGDRGRRRPAWSTGDPIRNEVI